MQQMLHHGISIFHVEKLSSDAAINPSIVFQLLQLIIRGEIL